MATETLFKAIADPSRREILRLLKKGSMTAGELASAFDMTKGAVSHHFNVLKGAGLVRTERRGQHIVYAINLSVFEEAALELTDLFETRSLARSSRGGRVRAPQKG